MHVLHCAGQACPLRLCVCLKERARRGARAQAPSSYFRGYVRFLACTSVRWVFTLE